MNEIRKMIKEELTAHKAVKKVVKEFTHKSDEKNELDYDWAKDIVVAASRLLSAIDDFEKLLMPRSGMPPTGPVLSAVSAPVGILKKSLLDMVANPLSYMKNTDTEIQQDVVDKDFDV